MLGHCTCVDRALDLVVLLGERRGLPGGMAMILIIEIAAGIVLGLFVFALITEQ